MKTTRFFTTLVVAFFTIATTFGQSQKPNAFFVTNNNERLYIYGNEIDYVGLTSIKYKNELGEKTSIKMGDIRYFLVNGELKSNFDGNPEFERVIAFNDKYILTYIHNAKKLYSVWDREYKEVESNINVNYSLEKREKILKETVFKYFKDCEPLQKALLSYDGGSMTSNDYRIEPYINYYNCGNAPDIILEDGKKPSYLIEKLTIGRPDPDYFGINKSGEKVFLHNYTSFMGENTIRYYAKHDAIAVTLSNTIDWKTLYINNFDYDRVFKNFKTEKDKLMMHAILAFSEKYVLTSDFVIKDWRKRNRFFIHDRQGNLVEKLFTEDKLPEMFDKYFNEYPDLKKMLERIKVDEEQLKREIKVEDVINYIKLGESTPDMINE